jgi:hypothetical protein
LKASQLFLKEKLPKRTLRKSDPFLPKPLTILVLFFFRRFFFSLKGCGAERCQWQSKRGGARAKQRETKRRAGFDYVLPMVKSGKNKPQGVIL